MQFKYTSDKPSTILYFHLVLPITIVSISRQVPQSSRSQPASSKTGNQTTMSEVTQSAKVQYEKLREKQLLI